MYIRKINAEEIADCAEIIRHSFRTVADELGLTEENCPTNGAFLKDSKLATEFDNGTEMYVLIEDNIKKGFVAIEKVSDSTYYMEKLAVLPEYRKNGIGKILVDFVVENVKVRNGDKIGIGVVDSNKILVEWYEKLGFVSTGTKKFEQLPFAVRFMEYIVSK